MAEKNNDDRTMATQMASAHDGETNFDEIVLDANSGISEEEQRDILVQINGIAEKHRQSLSAGMTDGTETGGSSGRRFKAKKSGKLFPVLVNIFALVALAVGFFALYSFQSGVDVQAREGTRLFNDLERTLIDEIRRETGYLLAAKDREITAILSSLADVETQLNMLIAGSEVLTLEQQAMEGALRIQQEERRAALAVAREERSRILDEARSREAVLQAQLDARSREFTAIADRHAAELDAAREELARLAREQAQSAVVEAQVAGFFANIHAQVSENRFDDAEHTIGELREFINAPSFQGIRTIQARRNLYSQAANTLETLLEEYLATYAAMVAGALPPDLDAEARLQEEIAHLERTIEARDSTINALGAGATGTAQRISQLENSVDTLQRTNTTLQSDNTRLNTQVNTLEGNLTAQRQTADRLQQQVDTNQGQITQLNQELTNFRTQVVPQMQQNIDTERGHVAARNSQITQFDQALSEFEAEGLLPPIVRQRFTQIFQSE